MSFFINYSTLTVPSSLVDGGGRVGHQPLQMPRQRQHLFLVIGSLGCALMIQAGDAITARSLHDLQKVVCILAPLNVPLSLMARLHFICDIFFKNWQA